MPGQPGFAAAPPPPPKSKTGLIIGIVAAVLVVLVGGGIAAFVLLSGDDEPPSVTQGGQTATGGGSTLPTATTDPPETGGPEYETPEEALMAELPTDYVYELMADEPDLKEYWAGPPASEFDSVYLVERMADGGWEVVDSYPLEYGGVESTEEEVAQYTVEDFLYAIMEDRPEDAQALTVEPFANDPASASYGGGDFSDFTIEGVRAVGDGTYWVETTEIWYGNEELYKYHVVPTELGWRIRDLAGR
jgi:hypothetical protein